MKTIRTHNIKYHENSAEGSIREIKRRWYRIMIKKRVPRRLWNFSLVWVWDTGNLSWPSSKYTNGRIALEIVTGETPDISEYLDFSLYDWVVYRFNAGMGESSIGRWLGVSHKVGYLMSYWVLNISGHIISCVTVQRLAEDKKHIDDSQGRMKDYDEKIQERLKSKNLDIPKSDHICEFNRSSLDEYDQDFVNDVSLVISIRLLL